MIRQKKQQKTCNVKRLSVDQELFNCKTWGVEQELLNCNTYMGCRKRTVIKSRHEV